VHTSLSVPRPLEVAYKFFLCSIRDIEVLQHAENDPFSVTNWHGGISEHHDVPNCMEHLPYQVRGHFPQQVIKPTFQDMPYAEVDLYSVTKDLPADTLPVRHKPYNCWLAMSWTQ